MALKDLSDAELGHIVRECPIWPILLNMEKAQETGGNGKSEIKCLK
jgi:hypothetical protein